MTTEEDRQTITALQESERILQRQIDEQAKEIDRLRTEVDKLNSSEWKMDPWMQERFRTRAIQWGDACLLVEEVRDRGYDDEYVDTEALAKALGLDEDESSEKAATGAPDGDA